MSSALAELERRWRGSGLLEDELAWLRALGRSGRAAEGVEHLRGLLRDTDFELSFGPASEGAARRLLAEAQARPPSERGAGLLTRQGPDGPYLERPLQPAPDPRAAILELAGAARVLLLSAADTERLAGGLLALLGAPLLAWARLKMEYRQLADEYGKYPHYRLNAAQEEMNYLVAGCVLLTAQDQALLFTLDEFSRWRERRPLRLRRQRELR
jgi:hypothetical protein